MRGGSLGHHLAFEREGRAVREWQSEQFGDLIHILGAMAAELVFYGENSNGVCGDLEMPSRRSRREMVGQTGMAPHPIDLRAAAPNDETVEQMRERLEKRVEQLGLQLLNRTRGGGIQQDPVGSIFMDAFKRQAAAQIVGQAFVIAYNFIQLNEDKVETRRRGAPREEGDLRRRADRGCSTHRSSRSRRSTGRRTSHGRRSEFRRRRPRPRGEHTGARARAEAPSALRHPLRPDLPDSHRRLRRHRRRRDHRELRRAR